MNRIISWLREAFVALKKNFLTHPAVSVSLMFTAVALFVILIDRADHERVQLLQAGLAMVPWAIMLALVMDRYLGGFAIKPSLASLILIAVGMFFPVHITDWIWEPSFNVIYFIVLPLLLVTYRMRVSDRAFIREVIWTMFSAGAALLVAILFVCIFCGIIHSCYILFDMSNRLHDNLLYLVYSISCALGVFVFVCVGERENYKKINMLVQPVSNYLIAPALLVYTIVLLAYIIKITMEHTLPDGGVAVMCIIWLLVSLYVAASQQTFEKHPYMWFGKIFGYIAIPIVIMLWVAAFRRVGDYGVTPYRYYLLLSALTATACVMTALFRRKNLYYVIAVTTAGVFLCSTILPWVNCRSVTGYSQIRIIRAEADSLGKLHDDGTIDSYGYSVDDEHGRKIVSAVSVLKRTYPASLSKLGLADDSDLFSKLHGDSDKKYVHVMIRRKNKLFETGSYSKILFDPYTSGDDVFSIKVSGEWETELRCSEFINRQLEKCGLDARNVTESQLMSHQSELLIYDGEGYRLILDHLDVRMIGEKELDTGWAYIYVKAVLFD